MPPQFIEGPAVAETRVMRFAGWELDRAAHELRVAGQRVQIGGRAFAVLRVLAERAGQVVARHEILERAWPGRVVEENNLTVQITALRKLLGHEAIVNVSGVGYRLAAKVLDDAPAGSVDAHGDTRTTVNSPALLGREDDLARLLALMRRSSVVTLVGTGGVGKTALARAAAASTAGSPPDGVHWLDLAALTRGSELAPVLHQALGLHADPNVADTDFARALASRKALVVLDNCEHLLDAVGRLLQRLQPTAPGLRWLCTSQQALGLAGETVLRLPPLAVPPADAASGAQDTAAVRLLRQRIEQSGSRTDWSDAEVRQAAELCRRLDGLPLAIEIAAARVEALGFESVLRQFDEGLRMRLGRRGVPDRHYSLLSTYEWSFRLLDPLEQMVFASLAPFTDGFDATLVRRMHEIGCTQEPTPEAWQILDALQALVAKSLVQRDTARAGRLHLLDSARAFARLQLAQRGLLQPCAAAHARTLAAHYAGAADDLERLRDAQWMSRYGPDWRNLHAALHWACAEGDATLQAQLVTALGALEDFAQTATELLGFPLDPERWHAVEMPWRARAWLTLGWAHSQDGSGERGTELALLALQAYEAAGDEVGVLHALTRLIRIYHGRPGLQHRVAEMGRRLQAIELDRMPLRARLTLLTSSAYLVAERRSLARLQELQAIAEHAGFDNIVAVCLVNITDELMVQGRDDEVVKTARAFLAGWRGLPRRRALVCHNLALSLVRMGRTDEAREPARVLLRSIPGLAFLVMDLFALAATREGRHHEAALIAGRSAAIKRERDLLSEVAEAAIVDETHRLLREALGATRHEELLAAGARLSDVDVLQLALPD